VKQIKTILKLFIFLLLGAGFIWLSLKDLTNQQINEIFNAFKQADYNWLILSFIIGIFSHIVRALRWKMLLEPFGYNPKVANLTFAVLIGYMANLALPRLGEVTRCGSLTKYEKISFTKSFGTVITERAFDLISFLILFFIDLIFQFDKIHKYFYVNIYLKFAEKYSNVSFLNIAIFCLVSCVLCLFFIFILRKKISHFKSYIKVKETIISFWHGISSITLVKSRSLFILYTVLIWFFYWLSTYVCFFCFSFTNTLGMGAAFTILVFGAIGVMITPGGIGAYTFIVAGVLINIYKTNTPDANAFGWMVWSAQTIVVLVAGTISLIIMSGFNKKYIPKIVVDEINK
jgi:glycosyltransferase 2 family protein